MNRYVVSFVYLKGMETPCITRELVKASDKNNALHLIERKYDVLKWLDIDRQF